MKKKYQQVTITIATLFSVLLLSSCQNGTQQQPDLPSEAEQATSKEKQDDSLPFEEYDIISIELDEQRAPMATLLASDYIIQNKSDLKTVSNLTFEYVTLDEDGMPVKLLIENEPVDYPIALEPRERAELSLSCSLDNSEALRTLDDAKNTIISYSYDMDGKRYSIDLDNETAHEEEIEATSNVDFNAVNIISWHELDYQSDSSCVLVNNGASAIKTLTATMVVYDDEGIARDVAESNPIVLGQGELAPSQEVTAKADSLLTSNGGHVEPVAYTYEIGTADANGYNRFEVNLITGQAYGSSNPLLLDSSESVSIEDARAEIDAYTNTFGSKVDDIAFKVTSIEPEGTTLEQLHLEGKPGLFGLNGETVLLRDYNSLLIKSMRFESGNADTNTQTILFGTLKSLFGDQFESTYDYTGEELDYVTWNVGAYRVNMFPNSCTVTIIQNEE